MKFNSLWKMMLSICKLLIKMNTRIKALDTRIKSVEAFCEISPGSDTDMAAEIKAIQDSITARIE